MNNIKKGLIVAIVAILATGCAQKVTIKALNPAEVGAMASKKKVAVNRFKNDKLGLSGKIEAEIARQKLDKKRYFTVLSRKDMAKVIAEQKLQSSDVMNQKETVKVGKLVGAQAIVTGEVASADATSSTYQDPRKECLEYYKDGECANWHFYKVTCKTTQASVSANINIIDVEKGSIIYGDTFTKNYSGDSCKAGQTNLLLVTLDSGPKQILSKSQALNKLAGDIASEFVYKLTPNYIYISVTLLDSIKLESATDADKKKLENALTYVKAARYDKAKRLLKQLMDSLDNKSYVVAYDYGVINEATGNFDTAKELYTLADDLTVEPVPEINVAITRIDKLIDKRNEARKQMNKK